MEIHFANYIQRVGSGTEEMVKQCKAQGLPEPDFVLIRNVEFRTILPRDIYTDAFLKQSELNERQMRAVKLIKEKGSINLTDLKHFFANVTERTLSRDLQVLVDKGILRPRGEKKGRRYGF